MKYAKLDKENKVVNLILISPEEVHRFKNIVDITNLNVNRGDIWNLKTKTFSTLEVEQKPEEKTVYDEVRELKEKINELSQNISIRPK